ncbi:CDP-glycerol glycerophosphotransferase family protein [Spiribacter roseus]|uniref:CDP-glycerol glycerophosphotransferase family protein n=1 Tax=Spiribacter roseus TaxID=1855875 RepID=A0ABV3RZS0_9GAMM
MVRLVRVLRALSRKVFEKAIFAFSLPMPNEKGLVVFSMSRGRYWGNSRALFEYMVENASPGIRVVWLSDPALPADKVPIEYSNRFVSRHSLRGWFLCARAQLVVLSHGLGDFGLLREVAKRKKVFMLWHAITTKYCGLLDEKFDQVRKAQYREKESIFYGWLITSSDIDRYYSASYTGMDVNNIAVTGLPRNDQLFREGAREKAESEWVSILYAPTFRDYPVEGGSVFFPFPHNPEEVAEWARSAHVRFFLRPHPNDTGSVEHVRALSGLAPDVFLDEGGGNTPDVMDLLVDADGIITDYSSIYVDGLALDMPVAFVDYDRDRYTEMRGLAYDYNLITPGPKVRSWPEFKQACEGMASSAKEWAEQREFVRQMFFKYRDANACARVSALIEAEALR